MTYLTSSQMYVCRKKVMWYVYQSDSSDISWADKHDKN